MIFTCQETLSVSDCEAGRADDSCADDGRSPGFHVHGRGMRLEFTLADDSESIAHACADSRANTGANAGASTGAVSDDRRRRIIDTIMDVTILPAVRGRKGFDPTTIRIAPKGPARVVRPSVPLQARPV